MAIQVYFKIYWEVSELKVLSALSLVTYLVYNSCSSVRSLNEVEDGVSSLGAGFYTSLDTS